MTLQHHGSRRSHAQPNLQKEISAGKNEKIFFLFSFKSQTDSSHNNVPTHFRVRLGHGTLAEDSTYL